jgi:predicted phosphoribosyltransferase
VEAPRTLITADMVRPQSPAELEIVMASLAALDMDDSWLEWYYEEIADWFNTLGTSYEEWRKLRDQDVADFLAKHAAKNTQPA